MAEYALILALIAIVAIIALIFLGGQVSKILSTVAIDLARRRSQVMRTAGVLPGGSSSRGSPSGEADSPPPRSSIDTSVGSLP